MTFSYIDAMPACDGRYKTESCNSVVHIIDRLRCIAISFSYNHNV